MNIRGFAPKMESNDLREMTNIDRWIYIFTLPSLSLSKGHIKNPLNMDSAYNIKQEIAPLWIFYISCFQSYKMTKITISRPSKHLKQSYKFEVTKNRWPQKRKKSERGLQNTTTFYIFIASDVVETLISCKRSCQHLASAPLKVRHHLFENVNEFDLVNTLGPVVLSWTHLW